MFVLFLIIAMSAIGFGLVLPSFLFVAGNMGASPALATVIFATYSFGQFLATPLWGRLSDRWGRKPVLAVSMVGATVSYFLLAYADSLWTLAAARALGGLMAGNFSAAMAYISDVTTAENRARGMGVVGAGMSIGFTTGPMVGGLLGGGSAETATLFLPGLVAAGVALLTVLAVIFLLPESLSPEQRDQLARMRGSVPREGVIAVVRRPVLTQMLLTALLFVFAMGLFETIFPLWSEARFGFGPVEVGRTFTFLGFIIAIVQGILIGPLTRRFGEQRLVASSALSYMTGLLIMAFSPTWAVMLLGISFTAVGAAIYNTALTTLVSMEAGEHERGFVLGVYQSSAWLGRALGPLASGFIFVLGVNMPLLVGAALLIPVTVLIASFCARINRRPAPTAEKG